MEAAEARRKVASPCRLPENREDSAILLDGERPRAGAGGSHGVLDYDRCGEGRHLEVGRVRGPEGAQEPGQAGRLLGVEEIGLVRDDERDGAHGAASPTPYPGGQAANPRAIYPIGASARAKDGKIFASQLPQPVGTRRHSNTRYCEKT